MAIDRALSPRSSRMADDLTLSGLLDVLDRAEELPLRHRPRPVRAVVPRPGALRRPGRPLPTARPVPVPAARPRPVAEAPRPRPGLRVRLRALVRRLALWGAGPDGANLAWGRPAAPAPRPDAPVVLTELPSTPTIRPAASSPAAALRPAGAPRPALPARTARPAATRVPVVAPLARQVPAPRPAPAPGTARAGRTTAGPRASSPARSRGDPRPPPARGSPSG